MVISTCKVCGETFLSKRKSELCQDKSTCRVKWSREQKKIQAQSEKMIVDMETFTAYQAVISQSKFLETALQKILDRTNKDTFKIVVFEILAAQSNN